MTVAAVLYVFRTLIAEPIPLNAGCLRPLTIVVPARSMLDPVFPAAVVAGNVETSQCIVDALYGALGLQAASQGTMNNFTFGNERYQYYETIAGGAGAGPDYDGASGVQTHMTNSRLTDPGGAREPVSGAAARILAARRIGRRRRASRRRRAGAADRVPRTDDRGDPVESPAHCAVRPRRRRAGSAGHQSRDSRRRALRDLARDGRNSTPL